MQNDASPPATTGGATTKYVVDDSPIKASATTIISLVFFGISLFGALMRLASAHDLNAIRALLLRDDTLGWIASVATLLAPTFWLFYRSIRTWFAKKAAIEIAAASPIATLKSEIVAAPVGWSDPLAPTRAPETTTRTRLVDPGFLMPGNTQANDPGFTQRREPSGTPGPVGDVAFDAEAFAFYRKGETPNVFSGSVPPEVASTVRVEGNTFTSGVSIEQMKPGEEIVFHKQGEYPKAIFDRETGVWKFVDSVHVDKLEAKAADPEKPAASTDAPPPYIPGDVLDLRDPAPKKDD